MEIGIAGMLLRKELNSRGYQFDKSALIYIDVKNQKTRIKLDELTAKEGTIDEFKKLSDYTEKVKGIFGYNEIHVAEIEVPSTGFAAKMTVYGKKENVLIKKTISL